MGSSKTVRTLARAGMMVMAGAALLYLLLTGDGLHLSQSTTERLFPYSLVFFIIGAASTLIFSYLDGRHLARAVIKTALVAGGLLLAVIVGSLVIGLSAV